MLFVSIDSEDLQVRLLARKSRRSSQGYFWHRDPQGTYTFIDVSYKVHWLVYSCFTKHSQPKSCELFEFEMMCFLTFSGNRIEVGESVGTIKV